MSSPERSLKNNKIAINNAINIIFPSPSSSSLWIVFVLKVVVLFYSFCILYWCKEHTSIEYTNKVTLNNETLRTQYKTAHLIIITDFCTALRVIVLL